MNHFSNNSEIECERPTLKVLFFTTILLLLLVQTIVAATTIAGKVVKVADGDTITILTPQNKQVKIRLYGVDTPERKQPYSKKAGQFTSSLVAGKDVHVEVYDTDRYGRKVGVVYVGNTNVNQEVVRAGFAWQYRKYCKAPFCSDWLTLEKKAREAKIGLWVDPKPMQPWEWRKSQRN